MIWQGLFIPSAVSLAVPLALMSLTRFLTSDNYAIQNETVNSVSSNNFYTLRTVKQMGRLRNLPTCCHQSRWLLGDNLY
jgi:hypothetical protein